MVESGSKTFKTDMGTVKITPVEKQGDWGLYMWKLPNGKILGDPDGNVLNIPGRSHDFIAMQKLREAAKDYGQLEGTVIFKAHISRVTEDEYQEQLERMIDGKIPSLTDQGAWAAAAQTEEKWGSE